MSAVTRALVKPLAVASLSLATLLPVLAGAQAVQLAPESPVAVVGGRAPVPYRVGEELTYKATFGVIPAGTARMRVDGVEMVRGRPAYHVIFTLDGGVPFFRVHDRYDSWIDVQTLSSLRHVQRMLMRQSRGALSFRGRRGPCRQASLPPARRRPGA